MAASSEVRSPRSPRTSSAPAAASVRAAGVSGSRTRARTQWPAASSPRAVAPPWAPVAPVTRTVIMFSPSGGYRNASGGEQVVSAAEGQVVDQAALPGTLDDGVGEPAGGAWRGHDLGGQLPGARQQSLV